LSCRLKVYSAPRRSEVTWIFGGETLGYLTALLQELLEDLGDRVRIDQQRRSANHPTLLFRDRTKIAMT
jgi:hypothetical protein